MRTTRYWLILGAFISSLGCSQSAPNFQTLDQSAIPMPMFSGATSTEILSLTATQTYQIQGQCDRRIQGLNATAVGSSSGFASLAAMSVSGVSVTCTQNGQFSFTLKSLTDLGFTIHDNTTYVIQLYALTNAGNSNPSTISILYSKEGGTGPKRLLITSGGTGSSQSQSQQRISTSPSFRAEVRIDHQLNQYTTPTSADSMLVKTSPSFKVKIGSAAEND